MLAVGLWIAGFYRSAFFGSSLTVFLELSEDLKGNCCDGKSIRSITMKD